MDEEGLISGTNKGPIKMFSSKNQFIMVGEIGRCPSLKTTRLLHMRTNTFV
jgi:hypothetical protein